MSFRRQTLKPFLQTFQKGFQYFCVVAYFWPWSYKTAIRHNLKVGSLWTLLITSSLLLVEVLMELIGADRIHHWISAAHLVDMQGSFASLGPIKNYVLPALFILAVLYLFWHHYTEIGKPGYEFAFLRQLNRFLRERDANQSEEALIPAALRVFHKVFEDSHIEHCSMYTVSNDALTIPDAYIYPDAVGQGYQINLNIGEGVAGLVFKDALPRYVPRLLFPFTTWRKFLPSIPFPHAVKFEPQLKGDVLELVNEDLDFYAFKNPNNTEPTFRSFVSVPLKPVGVEKCFGVLNFDFSKVDALDKSGIAMASVLGLILADEVNRIRNEESSRKEVENGNRPRVRSPNN